MVLALGIMSSNREFISACHRIRSSDLIESIDIIYEIDKTVRSSKSLIVEMSVGGMKEIIIQDKKMGQNEENGWAQLGNAVKESNIVKQLSFCISIVDEFDDEEGHFTVYPNCLSKTSNEGWSLRAFFDNAKNNKSINTLVIDWLLITGIPSWDWNHFVLNNESLNTLELQRSGKGFSHQKEAMQFLALLKDVKHMDKIIVNSGNMLDYHALDIIMFGCQIAATIQVECADINSFKVITKKLLDPRTQWNSLCILIYGERMDHRNAANNLIWCLHQNKRLSKLRILGEESAQYIDDKYSKLLCNTYSFKTICESNHSLHFFEAGWCNPEDTVQICATEYQHLNKNDNKAMVLRTKLMKFYFGKPEHQWHKADLKSFEKYPIGLWPFIMSIENGQHTTAIFNIIKYNPPLCDRYRNTTMAANITNSYLSYWPR